MFGRVCLQRKVSHHEAVRVGEVNGQLHHAVRDGRAGRVPERHGRYETKPSVQLQVQARHEKGKELPSHLLEYLPEFARYLCLVENIKFHS